MNALIICVTFFAVSLLVMGIYLAINDVTSRRLEANEKRPTGRLPTFDTALPLHQTAVGQPAVDDVALLERLQLWIEQSGIRMRPGVVLIASASAALVSSGLVYLLVGQWWWAVLALLVTAGMPFAVLAVARQQRTDKLRAQLPDALDLMSRMLRAGQTIPQALRGVADEFESPIADEFGYCYEQQNLGLSTDASMYEMARRTGALELRILVVALTVHRQTGGNLSELLDNLADVIRDRYRIQGQIRSLTADGRMQAAILLALPPLLLVVLSVLNRDYVTILFQFPWLLGGMFGFELFGAFWLHRIVSFDY